MRNVLPVTGLVYLDLIRQGAKVPISEIEKVLEIEIVLLRCVWINHDSNHLQYHKHSEYMAQNTNDKEHICQ